MKELSRLEIATCKRTAASVKIWRTQLAKKKAKRDELNVEIETLEATIAKFEAPIVELTGGFTSEQVLNGEMEASISKVEEIPALENKEVEVELHTSEVSEEIKPENVNPFDNSTDNTDPLPFEV